MPSEASVRRYGPASPAVLLVYLAGLLQGLTLVSFPAVSVVLKQSLGLSDAAYGSIFLPQVTMTVLGAVAGGSLARKLGLKRLLIAALAANGLSQVLLAASAQVEAGMGFAVILAGTAVLGLGFGLLGAPINSYPPILFPKRGEAAVVAVHTLLGLGLATGPLVAAQFVSTGAWAGFPLLLLALAAVLTLAAVVIRLPAQPAGGAQKSAAKPPIGSLPFWIFVVIAVIYAFAEGTFSSWAVIYLQDGKGLPEMVAGLALSAFWGALVAGRMAASVLVTVVPARVIWLSLPLLMIAAFLSLPYVSDVTSGIGLFALAGLACSAFFPLTITLVSARFPEHVAWVSSMMIAALMVGVGVGSFVIGALRESLAFEDLYRFSALYPASAMALAAVVVWGGQRQPAAEGKAAPTA
jgi:fucose permease